MSEVRIELKHTKTKPRRDMELRDSSQGKSLCKYVSPDVSTHSVT